MMSMKVSRFTLYICQKETHGKVVGLKTGMRKAVAVFLQVHSIYMNPAAK